LPEKEESLICITIRAFLTNRIFFKNVLDTNVPMPDSCFAMKTPIYDGHISARLSEEEVAVLKAIAGHIKKFGNSPSYDEIARYVERSKSTAKRTIDRLIRKGILAATANVHRSLTITELGKRAARRRK
jgi:DNA-binding MarR family transcriptional regulator